MLLWKKYKILLAWLGFEPMISRSEVHHANHYTIEASYKEGQIFHVESYNVLHFCEVKIKMHVTYNEWILVKNTYQYLLGPKYLSLQYLSYEIEITIRQT